MSVKITLNLTPDLKVAERLARAYWFAPYMALFRSIEAAVVSACLDQLTLESPVLDVGCGDGMFAEQVLNPRGVKLVGLDLNTKAILRARARCNYVWLFRVDARFMPLASNVFPFAFSNSSLEHMQQIEIVLAEIERVLKPGGKLLFTVPTDLFAQYLLGTAIYKRLGKAELASRYADSRNATKAHVNVLSIERWRELLRQAGFNRVHTITYLNARSLRFWDLLDMLNVGCGNYRIGSGMRHLGNALQRLGWNISTPLGAIIWRMLARTIERDLNSSDSGGVAIFLAEK